MKTYTLVQLRPATVRIRYLPFEKVLRFSGVCLVVLALLLTNLVPGASGFPTVQANESFAARNFPLSKPVAPTDTGSPPLSPTVSLAFEPSTIGSTGVTTLKFTLTNPNLHTAFTNLSFTANLSSHIKIASSPDATSSCANSTIGAIPSTTSFSLSGVVLGITQSCTVNVKITSADTGGWTAVITTLSANEIGAVSSPATASLTVLPPGQPFVKAIIPLQGEPNDVVVNPLTGRAYVTEIFSDDQKHLVELDTNNAKKLAEYGGIDDLNELRYVLLDLRDCFITVN